MTRPHRIITYKLVVQAESGRTATLEEVAAWAEDSLHETFRAEGYDVTSDPPTITDLRGKTLRY